MSRKYSFPVALQLRFNDSEAHPPKGARRRAQEMLFLRLTERGPNPRLECQTSPKGPPLAPETETRAARLFEPV